MLGRMGIIFPNMGIGLEQTVILATLIGGTPLGVGVGNVLGGLLGAGIAVLLNEISRTMQIKSGFAGALLVRGISFVVAALVVHLYYLGVGWLYAKRTGAASQKE